MKSILSRKGFIVAVCFCFVVSMVAPMALPSHRAEAAKKTTLQNNKAEIAVGEKTHITLKNKDSKSSYMFTSSKANIALVNSKGAVVGNASGNASILVERMLNGKKTKVGVFKVKVLKSTLAEKSMELFVDETYRSKDYIDNYNTKAKYKYTSSNKSVVKVSTTGTLKAIEEGECTIKVLEIYNKKTRLVGTITITVMEDYYDDEEDDEEDDEDDSEEDN